MQSKTPPHQNDSNLEPFSNLPFDRNSVFLVIVNYYDYNINWSKKLKMPYIVYYKNTPEKEPFTASNKGKSETNILKFIFDFYDNLPQNLIFLHQYEHKFYHKGSIVKIINDKTLPDKYKQSKTNGFYSVNSYVLGDIHPQIPKMLESKWWQSTMEPYFGPIHDYHNFTKGKLGCSQFIVSRDRIHSLPRNFYENMYKWIVKHTLLSENEYIARNPITKMRKPTAVDGHVLSNWHVSRYLEWTWELIFTVHKPWEKNYLEINEKKVICLYGVGKYRINVNHIIKLHFLQQNTIYIPHSIDFANYFPSVVQNTTPLLLIYVNENEFTFKTCSRKKDILLKIN